MPDFSNNVCLEIFLSSLFLCYPVFWVAFKPLFCFHFQNRTRWQANINFTQKIETPRKKMCSSKCHSIWTWSETRWADCNIGQHMLMLHFRNFFFFWRDLFDDMQYYFIWWYTTIEWMIEKIYGPLNQVNVVLCGRKGQKKYHKIPYYWFFGNDFDK